MLWQSSICKMAIDAYLDLVRSIQNFFPPTPYEHLDYACIEIIKLFEKSDPEDVWQALDLRDHISRTKGILERSIRTLQACDLDLQEPIEILQKHLDKVNRLLEFSRKIIDRFDLANTR